MTTRSNDNLGRRGFLKALLFTAASASVVGGGAAYLLKKSEGSLVISPVSTPPASLPAVSAGERVVTANSDATTLLAQLAKAEAENLRLHSELEAAKRRLENLEANNGDASTENESLRTELAAATEEVSLLSGLVALYEQLDEIDLVETVDNGLESFGTTIGGLVDELPQVEESLALGRQALDDFVAQLPFVKNGREWLESHLARLDTFYAAAEAILTAVVETADSFLDKLNEWFAGIRKWLPFNVGERAAEVMTALANVLDETPNTIHGLRRNVAEPLDVWLQNEGEDVAVHNHLVKPLREEALAKADHVVIGVRDAKTTYETQLVEPVKAIAEQRRALREQIAEYRQKHEV